MLKISNFLRLCDIIRWSPKCKLKYKRRKSHRGTQWWKFLINIRKQQAVLFDSLAASWITPSPSAIPIPSPAFAELLNKTDAPINPTRHLLYTVNHLRHLVTQFSSEVSHWQQRSEQWRSHQPQHHESCFCPASSCLCAHNSLVLLLPTETGIHFRSVTSF